MKITFNFENRVTRTIVIKYWTAHTYLQQHAYIRSPINPSIRSSFLPSSTRASIHIFIIIYLFSIHQSIHPIHLIAIYAPCMMFQVDWDRDPWLQSRHTPALFPFRVLPPIHHRQHASCDASIVDFSTHQDWWSYANNICTYYDEYQCWLYIPLVPVPSSLWVWLSHKSLESSVDIRHPLLRGQVRVVRDWGLHWRARPLLRGQVRVVRDWGLHWRARARYWG
jgi:hypothetical protein